MSEDRNHVSVGKKVVKSLFSYFLVKLLTEQSATSNGTFPLRNHMILRTFVIHLPTAGYVGLPCVIYLKISFHMRNSSGDYIAVNT